MRRILAILILLVSALCGNAAVVHVTQQTVAGSTTNVLSRTTAETAASYTTLAAPAKSGYVFTHWSIEPASTNVFTSRDGLSRALDAAKYLLYEDVVLTAHYLPVAQDSDSDGLSDGQELYWYGSLDAVSGETDTDGDGVLFAIEIEASRKGNFLRRYRSSFLPDRRWQRRVAIRPRRHLPTGCRMVSVRRMRLEGHLNR